MEMTKEVRSVKKAPTNKNDSNPTMDLKDPRSIFLASVFTMSWQLAIVFLIPVIGGYKLDQHLKTSPTYFLIGLVIAVIGVVLVLRNVLREFNTTFIKPGVTKK
jgi:F0F1-type ATP synthase assembly protein I